MLNPCTHTLRLHELGAFQMNCPKIRVDIIRYVTLLKEHRDYNTLTVDEEKKYRERVKKLWN
jgi:hypothetical protein